MYGFSWENALHPKKCKRVCLDVGGAHPLSELAGRSKVDYLDGRSLGVTKKDVFWFQVTVDD